MLFRHRSYRQYREMCRRRGIEPHSRERVAVLVATWYMKLIARARRTREQLQQTPSRTIVSFGRL